MEFVARSRRRTLAAIEVVDTGRGIEPQRLPEIFAPLPATRTGESTVWLGLPYSRQKVERSEGHICVVRSRPGETLVRILLPLLSDL
jgi:nitrogen-specific signal transduction histidine kinase